MPGFEVGFDINHIISPDIRANIVILIKKIITNSDIEILNHDQSGKSGFHQGR